MAAGADSRGSTLEQAALLDLWEENATAGGVSKALALLAVAHPEAPRHELANFPIGQRDGDLLDLYEQLFGKHIQCTADCANCGRTIETTFGSAEVRLPPSSSSRFSVRFRGITVEARLPDSLDLAMVEDARDSRQAWRALVERCIVAARRRGKPVPASDLPDELLEALDVAAADADPQADIVLNMTCPDCGFQAQLSFDIANQTWAKLDHWARSMFAAVDLIAARYGWSEAEILALRPARRQSYLDIIGGAA